MKCLYGHTALVGLLCLSDKFLVSAAADGSLRGWDSNDYSRKFSFHHTNLAAITSFSMNDNILVSGSERQFNVYNLRTGKLIHRKLLTDAEQVWGIKFNNRKLVAAIESVGHSYVEILDFATRNGDKTLRTRTRTRVDQQIDHNSLWSSTLWSFFLITFIHLPPSLPSFLIQSFIVFHSPLISSSSSSTTTYFHQYFLLWSKLLRTIIYPHCCCHYFAENTHNRPVLNQRCPQINIYV